MFNFSGVVLLMVKTLPAKDPKLTNFINDELRLNE